MHRFAKVGIAAALILTLTGATEDLRFRYLGRVGDFALMATEATGPQTERSLSAILANRQANGPGGTDNAMWQLNVNCDERHFMLTDVHAYLGTDLKREVHGGNSWDATVISTVSANGMILRYACTGEAKETEEVWLIGDDSARAYALERAHGNDPLNPGNK